MKLLLSLDEQDARAWLHALASVLRDRGHDVVVEVRKGHGEPLRSPSLLLRAENWLYGVSGDAWLNPYRPPAVTEPAGADRIRIAISPRSPDEAAFHLAVEDGPFSKLIPLLGNGIAPRLILSGPAGKVWMALPASERPFSLAFTLDAYVARLGLLIDKAVNDHPAVTLPPQDKNRRSHHLVVAYRHFLRKLLGKLSRTRFRADHWNVGVRRRRARDGAGTPNSFTGFRWVADDGKSYYADPILWEDGDRAFLLIEVFPFETMKGYLAVAELDDHGAIITPFRPILVRDGHLSYPFLFRHDGDTYMIPENAAEGHLPLYRARQFPDEWEACGTLLDVPLQDATLIEHGGLFWLLGNESRGGSSWDCLCAYWASNPLGPYTPHPANPLVIDARQARSAGPAFQFKEGLYRPVQDCLGGYGMAIHFARIDELSLTDFRQECIATFAAPAGHQISGVHTYSRSERFEAIDALTTYAGRLAR